MRVKRQQIDQGGEQLLLITPNSDWKTPEKLPDLRQYSRIAVDTENKDDGLAAGKGPGWAIGKGYICGISIAWRDTDLHSAYFPIQHPDTSVCFPKEVIKRWLKSHMRAGVKFTFHNGPYDVGWLDHTFNLGTDYKIDDTGCMAYMIDENRLSYSLNALCKWRGLPGKDENVLRDAAAWYNLDPKSGLWKLPARYVGQYAEQDALSTLLLAESLEKDLEQVQAAYQLEMDLLPMVHQMRKRGICIDQKAAARAYTKFKTLSQEALINLSDQLGQRTGMDEIRSNKWLENVFTLNKIPFPHTAKTGAPSFEAKWMRDYDHWLPQLIVRAKQFEDAAEKFIKGYVLDFMHNGRVHASIHQFKSENLYNEEKYGGGTRTYRFSYSDPPLQQIPRRNEELYKEIRGMFIPEKGERWLSADYSQQEYRLIVHYASTMGFAKADEAAARYIEDPDTDFHSMVAEMTGLDRKPAKDCNFAKAYGAQAAKFSMMIKKSRQEAEKIMAQYDEKLPFVKQLFEYCQSVAEKRGYIKLLDGAHIHFDWWFAWETWAERQTNQIGDCTWGEAQRRAHDPSHPWFGKTIRRSRCHKAMNSLIQGGAARQMKLAMRDCWRAGHVPLLQVHDELCFSIKDRKVSKQIEAIMCNAVPLKIPMRVDLMVGHNWAG
jgi:Mesyanzhinovviridae DNA polymerase